MNTKPYGNDFYNSGGYNVKKEGNADIVGYLNFILSDDVITSTR